MAVKMPFPGMDPYLEHPVLWSGVQARLIVGLANQLGLRLRPRYVVSIEDRVFFAELEPQPIPDVCVQAGGADGGFSTSATAHAFPIVVEIKELEIHEHYLEILDLYRDQKVVTVIEVVSPLNKTSGPGRASYQAKQRATLASECHLVEIDLLRRGRHILSVPRRATTTLQPYDYLVCVSRCPKRKRYELYPSSLRERLPTIRVPLAEPHPDVPLDIQAALEQVYEDGSYMLRLRYEEPCEPRLSAEDQQWANEQWRAYQAAHPELFPPPQPQA